MFDRIRKALTRPATGTGAQEPRNPKSSDPAHSAYGPMSQWAATQGFALAADDDGKGVAFEGKVGKHSWRMQLGKPSRNYIFGQEVRARAELGIDPGVACLVINRPLKEALEKRAYQIYTDNLQTSTDSSMPEEMRWLAMFDEVGWPQLGAAFLQRLAILSDRRENAQAWIDATFAQAMVNWPTPGPSAEVPFMVLLLNGKAYLRMEYTPADLMTLQHAASVFTVGCESALSAFGK
jgi:hypothetical protein